MSFLRDRFQRFLRDEDGIILAEFLILLPLLIWAFIAIFVYWDAFRVINTSQKASYAISDLISRQGDVTGNYIDGMEDVMGFLLNRADDVRIRITSVEWAEEDDQYQVLFSRSPSDRMPVQTSATLDDFRSRIPALTNLESVVIVETEVDYRPTFDVGVRPQTVRNFLVTRPRFYRRICMVESMDTCPPIF